MYWIGFRESSKNLGAEGLATPPIYWEKSQLDKEDSGRRGSKPANDGKRNGFQVKHLQRGKQPDYF
jgi:hypothetical protein